MTDLTNRLKSNLSHLPERTHRELPESRYAWCAKGNADEFADTMFDSKEFKAAFMEFLSSPHTVKGEFEQLIQNWIENLEDRKLRERDLDFISGDDRE